MSRNCSAGTSTALGRVRPQHPPTAAGRLLTCTLTYPTTRSLNNSLVAGPSSTEPSAENREPCRGQSHDCSASFQDSTPPRWVQIGHQPGQPGAHHQHLGVGDGAGFGVRSTSVEPERRHGHAGTLQGSGETRRRAEQFRGYGGNRYPKQPSRIPLGPILLGLFPIPFPMWSSGSSPRAPERFNTTCTRGTGRVHGRANRIEGVANAVRRCTVLPTQPVLRL